MASTRVLIGQAEAQQRADLALARGSTFMATSVITASVPQEPAKRAAEIVAGDVLHHPAARLESSRRGH